MTPIGTLHRPVLSRQARYRWDALRQEHQIVFPEGMMRLNETGAAIIQLCDGRSTEEIIESLLRRFPDAVAEDVPKFLQRLHQKGILCNAMNE